ncbi:MAG: integration host factor subunit alpha [Deltaproteobacteria bacterium]|nr:integration host factor subunit alpha [Deltaproteobacteria bacterium]
MTLTKAVLTEHVAAQTAGLTVRQAAAAVQETFALIKAALAGGENVLISGFGKFTVRDKHARVGRNPRTGKPITLAARRVVTFKVSVGLKAVMNR